jgi:hypothetical protein
LRCLKKLEAMFAPAKEVRKNFITDMLEAIKK